MFVEIGMGHFQDDNPISFGPGFSVFSFNSYKAVGMLREGEYYWCSITELQRWCTLRGIEPLTPSSHDNPNSPAHISSLN